MKIALAFALTAALFAGAACQTPTEEMDMISAERTLPEIKYYVINDT